MDVWYNVDTQTAGTTDDVIDYIIGTCPKEWVNVSISTLELAVAAPPWFRLTPEKHLKDLLK